MSGLLIRAGTHGDENIVHELLYELAQYEKLTDRFLLTPKIIARDFFGPEPACFCDLAFLDGAPAGVMTWYPIYMSFSASRGLFLEDLFVRPSQRGKGLGKALLAHLARRALVERHPAIGWLVLDWNQPSIDFYESLRAERAKGWFSYRLSGEALEDLAAS